MAVTIVENPTDAAQHERKYTININNTHLIYTTVTSSSYIVQSWIRDIIFLFHRDHFSHLVVGIGVQWTRFTPLLGRRPAATLQLCIGRRCLIYQLLHSIEVPSILRRILSVYPSITFVGVGSPRSYSQRLLESHHSLLLSLKNMPIDLRLCVFGRRQRRRRRPCGFHVIAERFLGLLYHQFDIMAGWNSDWEVQNLSPEQVSYASLLPFLSFITGIRIRAWRFNPNLYRVNHNDDNVDDR